MARFTILMILSLLLSVPVAAQECATSTILLPSGETSVCHLDCSGAVITCDFAGWSWDWASSWTPDGYPDSAEAQENGVQAAPPIQPAPTESGLIAQLHIIIRQLLTHFSDQSGLRVAKDLRNE